METDKLKIVIADQAIEIRELKKSLEEKGKMGMYWYEKCQGLEKQISELKNEKETDTNENNE